MALPVRISQFDIQSKAIVKIPVTGTRIPPHITGNSHRVFGWTRACEFRIGAADII
jgi:hypothetical protein